MTTFMVTDKEIAELLYIKQDNKIAHYLGVQPDRVSAIRETRRKPMIAAPDPIPEPLPEPAKDPIAEILAPPLCPTCGSPVSGRLTIMHIQALVAAYYKIPVREMTSDRRHKAVSHPRQVAMYLAYELTPKSLPDIGGRFGGRDHTTVIYAIKVVQKRMLADPEIESDVVALRERLAA